ncbi:MAG: YggS family pyridoxal phosphate-dependent enzyme [Bacteroidales bacterium]|jgi:pyridoxal phosphate enzyme (YggS family)
MIEANIKRLHARLPSHVVLVAVSKFQSAALIRRAYDAGQRVFGENRSRELLEKIPLLPKDIQWHFIGHLQTNKVKEVVGHVSLIQSVDRDRLLHAIQVQAEKLGIVQDVLLQVHIAQEETKHGYLPEEVLQVYKDRWPHVRICGLMGMATFTDNREVIGKEFRQLRQLFDTLKQNRFANDPSFAHCSMGMTDDYEIALEEGSTMLRIGSAIFPPRPTVPPRP